MPRYCPGFAAKQAESTDYVKIHLTFPAKV